MEQPKKSASATKAERKKQQNKALYFGALAGLFVIGLIGVIVWVANLNANAVVYTLGEYQVKRDLYTCVYLCYTMKTENWEDYGYTDSALPYEQAFTDDQGDKQYDTWGDFFEAQTNASCKYMLLMNTLAAKSGYTFSGETEKKIAEDLAQINEQKGNAESFENFMKKTYGFHIKKKVFVEFLTLYYNANEFYQCVTESKAMFNKYVAGNAQSFEQVYEENKDDLDVIDYRYYALKKSKVNAPKIEALRACTSEQAFRDLCNTYQNDEKYTENDTSLQQNVLWKNVKTQSDNGISKQILSPDSKAGDIYSAEFEQDSATMVEIVYLVRARHKNEEAYKESDVKMWEYQAMSVMLENCCDEDYPPEISQTGMQAFRDQFKSEQS